MERKKEFEVLNDVLSKTSITKINEACRLILKERVESIVCLDKIVLKLIETFISGYSPLIEMKEIKSEISHKKPVSKNNIVGCGVLGAAGLLMTTFVDSLDKTLLPGIVATRLFGCVAVGVAAVWGTYLWEQSKKKKEIVYNYEIKQTVEDVIKELDVVFDTFKKLLIHNQLECQYSSIFR